MASPVSDTWANADRSSRCSFRTVDRSRRPRRSGSVPDGPNAGSYGDQMSDMARFWWRVSAAVIVAVVGVGLGLHEMGIWTLSSALAAGLLIAGVLVAFFTAAEAAVLGSAV